MNENGYVTTADIKEKEPLTKEEIEQYKEFIKNRFEKVN